jgi:hypothetical protein
VEVIFNPLLRFYSFPVHLLSDLNKDRHLGLVFSDGIILPFTSIIFCHYVIQTQTYWRLILFFNLLQGILEWLYLSMGYLYYHKWLIGLSIAFYFIGSCLSARYASRLMQYNPPVPYVIRLAAATYSFTVWLGGIFSGLLGLFEWKPQLFTLPSAEERFPDVFICWVLALFAAIIVPKTFPKYKPIVFLIFAAFATFFYYFAYGQGWLIYHRWNHLLTALRWFVPFIIISWYDRWESAPVKNM